MYIYIFIFTIPICPFYFFEGQNRSHLCEVTFFACEVEQRERERERDSSVEVAFFFFVLSELFSNPILDVTHVISML